MRAPPFLRATPALAVAVALLAGCPRLDPELDGGGVFDSGPTESDGGPPGPDAGPDSGRDAGPVDAGPKIYPPVPAGEYCRRRAEAFCARAVRCGMVDPVHLAVCVGDEALACGERFIGAAASDGRIDYDAKLAGECVGALEDDPCWAERFPAACQKPFIAGKVAGGETCYQDFECVAGGYCHATGGPCTGVCAAWVSNAGDPCNCGDKRCDPTKFRCASNPAAGRQECRPLGSDTGADGGPSTCAFGFDCANWTYDCLPGFQCERPDGGSGRVCVREPPPSDRGGLCTYLGFPRCEPSPPLAAAFGGLYCRASSAQPAGTCAIKVAAGGACTIGTNSSPLYDQCQNALYCNAFYATGSCQQLAPFGETCGGYFGCRWSRGSSTYTDYRFYNPYVRCDSYDRRCKLYPAAGQSCDRVYRCHEASCQYDFTTRTYTCRARQPLGTPCSYDDERCVSGRCRVPEDGGPPVCLPPCSGDPNFVYVEDAGVAADGGGRD